jgi:NADPH:quinone reductase-like Zn-dependent oxidoreductase
MVRGVRFHTFGGPEVLQIENVIVPEPGPDEVRLRIKAIGLNRGEILMRSGRAARGRSYPRSLVWKRPG